MRTIPHRRAGIFPYRRVVSDGLIWAFGQTILLPNEPKFLVVDTDQDSRFFLSRTLLRKFPSAILVECQTNQAALRQAADAELSAVIVHRTLTGSAEELIPQLRAARPDIVIIWVSSVIPTTDYQSIGADRFLASAEWLRIGTVTAEALAERH